MMNKFLLVATAFLCAFSIDVYAQPRLLEKVVKKGVEIVIPYE